MYALKSATAALLFCITATSYALPASTSPANTLAKRAGWYVSWYEDYDCKDHVGTQGGDNDVCYALGFTVDIYSVSWEPGDAGESLYASNGENCGDQRNSFGPGDGGCHAFTQNVNPVGSFSVYQ